MTAAAASGTRLPKLGAALLASGHEFPQELAVPAQRASALPEKVLQFGEGNFLRAFVDWMFARMNRRGSFGGRVVAVQPIAAGMARQINEVGYFLVELSVEQGNGIVLPLEMIKQSHDASTRTLRYGWRSVSGHPCLVARQVVDLLRSGGWTGTPRRCGPGCALRP